MSFSHPLVLLGLLAVPAAVGIYLREQRRRAGARRAFVSAPLGRSVAPRRPGWRRHPPVALLGLAAAALIVAVAQPFDRVLVPVKSATVMLVNDVSDSMKATDVLPSRLQAAKRAAERFATQAPRSVRVGQIGFARRPTLLQSPTTDHALAEQAIATLKPGGGGTAIGEALGAALSAIETAPKVGGRTPPGAVILLSDGTSNVGVSPLQVAAQARARHVPIYTVAIGTASGTITGRHGNRILVPVSPQQLAKIAADSGGRAFTAGSSAGASAIYAHLARKLGHTHVRRTLIAGLAGAALGLLLIASALSLLWFGRLA
ncbi:MAG TPA: VWA domain-containing protein [Solirubrobacteraceae bacterium]|nr:VWA domain-containing protein [Solirubrobacteraceae bacterium]